MTYRKLRRPMVFAILILFALLPSAHSQAPAGAGAAPIAAGHPNLPNGYAMIAHLVCEGDNANATADGVIIAQTSGERRALGPDCLPFKGEAFGNQRIEFSIDGMDSSADYLLGFTWWDTGKQGRVQSLTLGWGPITDVRTVIPPTVPLAFHGDQPTYARVLVPLSRGDFPTGSCEMIVEAHAGPDAVVQEVWLMKRTVAIAQKRVLIVTGDDWTGHLWRDTGPELAAILREDPRLEVSITECPAFLGSPLLERYDAVVLHFKNYQERLPLADKTWLGLTRYVQNGHGLVLVHFGCGAFQEWEGYKKIVGGIWNPEKRAHDPYGPFQVCVADTAHPITLSMSGFDTQDELYTCLDTLSDIRVLFKATSKVDQVEYPMGFVVRDSERTFNCTLGHDVNALRSPGARTLYRRAALWAAGLEP